MTHFILGQVVGQVGNHDLGLGRNTILRGATLLLGARSTGLALGSLRTGSLVLVGGFSQRGSTISGFLTFLGLLVMSVSG